MIKVRCTICGRRESSLFVQKDRYQYYHCPHCRHVFLSPPPTEAQLKKLYSGDYRFNVDKIALHRFINLADGILRSLKELNPDGTTLLDVGTGYGTFVEIALSKGLRAMGIEPAKNLSKVAKQKLGNKVIHTDLEGFIQNNRRSFDFISLIHVIEHVEDPRKTLSNLYNLLRPNGILYVETPNIDSFLAFAEKEHYTFLTPPDHLNLYSPKSLKTLLESLNKQLYATYTTYSYPEHFIGILRSVKSLLLNDHHSSPASTRKVTKRTKNTVITPPFFDRVVAPILTPLLNIANRGSILQVYIQKKN